MRITKFSIVFLVVDGLQVLDRLKACSAFIQLAQGFTKSTKTAESKIAKAAAKLSRLPSLQELQAVANAAAEAVQLARQHSAAAAKVSSSVVCAEPLHMSVGFDWKQPGQPQQVACLVDCRRCTAVVAVLCPNKSLEHHLAAYMHFLCIKSWN